MHSRLPLLPPWGSRFQPVRLPMRAGEQIDGDTIRVDAVFPIDLKRLIELARALTGRLLRRRSSAYCAWPRETSIR